VKRSAREGPAAWAVPGWVGIGVAAVFRLAPEGRAEGIPVPARHHVLNNGVTVLVREKLSASFDRMNPPGRDDHEAI
jgi:hypothetical protein